MLCLFRLDDEGFKCSEGDPLLIVDVDLENPDSMGHFRLGNFGMSVAPGGQSPGPIPPPTQQTPALGRFIDNQPNIEDKSAGGFCLFYAKTLGDLHQVAPLVQDKERFRRKGPFLAQELGVKEEATLVSFHTLDAMRSQPRIYPGNRLM